MVLHYYKAVYELLSLSLSLYTKAEGGKLFNPRNVGGHEYGTGT
jgi:hypothetical protein